MLIFWRVPVYLFQGQYWVLDRLAAIEAWVWAAVLGIPLVLGLAGWRLYRAARDGAPLAAAGWRWRRFGRSSTSAAS